MNAIPEKDIPLRASEDGAMVPVRFQYFNCDAETVCVAGTFNDWHPRATPLARYKSRGVWVKDLKLAEGTYEYNFIVDGHWKPDPNCWEMTDNPFGGLNSVLHVKKLPQR